MRIFQLNLTQHDEIAQKRVYKGLGKEEKGSHGAKKGSAARRIVSMIMCLMLCLNLLGTAVPMTMTVKAMEAGSNQSSDIGLALNLVCTSTEGSANNVGLHWDTTLEHDLYVVYRSLQEKDGYTPIYQGVGESCYDYNLKMNTTYYYQVAAVNDGQYTYSPVQKITTCEPQTTDVYNNQTGSSLVYETSGTKVGDTYYSYSMKSNGDEKYFVEKTSSDGINFSNERTIVDKNDNSDLGFCKIESVQQKYIASKNIYIIWAHWEQPSGYADGKALVITGTPGGDFTVHHIYNPLDVEVRDMTIFVDDDEAETGYLITAANEHGEGANKTMYIFQMNESYSDVTRIVKKVHENAYREFPNMVKKDGYYYLFTSQAAGWYPSKGGYIVTKDLGGTWSDLRDIGNSSTFSSQSGWVVNLANGTNYIMHAYRWLKSSDTSGTTLCPLYFANGFAFYEYYPYFRYSTKTGELYPVQEGSLLSQGKPSKASVSAKADANRVESAFDGSYETSYTASGCTWPFSIEVDLEKECDLKNVQISWYICKGSEAFYQYKIEGSTDGSNYTTLLDRTDSSNERVSKTYGFTSDLVSGRARYVRIYVEKAVPQNNPNNNWYTPTVYEVKVFGDAASDSQYEEAKADIQYDFDSSPVNGTVEDVSGNSNALSLQGNASVVQDAQQGNVLYLDGNSGTYAKLPTGILDYQNELTVSMDVKSESTGNFFTFALGNDSNKYFFTKVRNDQFRAAITTGSYSTETGLKTVVDGRNWHRYTFVLNETTAKLYVDGVLTMANLGIGTKISDLGSSLECTIGKSTYSADGYFKGYIDNITIYKKALSQKQIQQSHECTFGDWEVVKEATCTDNGEKKRVCSGCGAEETEVITATGHTINTEWSKDASGHWHTCSKCSAKEDEATHTFGDWTIVSEASCGQPGSKKRSCTVCGYTETATVEATDHVVDANVWESDDNNHWHTCSKCNTKVDASAHTYGDWEIVTQASCGTVGSKKRTCTVCGKTETAEVIATDHTVDADVWKSDDNNHWHTCSKCNVKVDESAHTYGDWEIVTEAKCGTIGSKKRTCTVCGKTETAEVIATDHTVDADVWESDDNNHWHTCSKCNVKVDESAHTYGAWEIVTEATCSENGMQKRSCTVCGKVQTSEILATKHTADSEWTGDGQNHWHVCTACGEELDTAKHECLDTWESDEENHWHVCTICGMKLDESAHDMKWIVDVEASAGIAGKRHQECKECGYVGESEAIPPYHTHDYQETWDYDTDTHWHECSICSDRVEEAAHEADTDVCEHDDSYHWNTCNICGAKVQKTEHTYGEWEVVKEATCDCKGVKQRTCTVCGNVDTESIPCTAHTSTDKWNYNEDNHWQCCSVCGQIDEVAEHAYGEWKVVFEATADSVGLKKRECLQCGKAQYAQIPAGTVIGDENDATTEPNEDQTTQGSNAGTTGSDEDQTTQGSSIGTTEPNNDQTTQSPITGTTEPNNNQTTQSPTTGTTEPNNDQTTQSPITGTTEPNNNQTTQSPTIGTTEPNNNQTTQSPVIGTTEPNNDQTAQSPVIGTTEPNNDQTTQNPADGSTQGNVNNTTQNPDGITTQVNAGNTTQSPAVTTQNPAGTTDSNLDTSKIPAWNELISVASEDGGAVYRVVNPDTYGKGTVIYVQNTDATAKKVTIPDQVVYYGITYKVVAIADKAFYNNKNLKSVVIGQNVLSIGNQAFAKCSKLTKVVIGKNVKSIGKMAFYKCTNLKQITIKGKKITKIGKNAIAGIYKKAIIKVPASKKKYYKKLWSISKGFRSGMKVK